MIRQHRESVPFDRLLPVEGKESDVSFKLKTAGRGFNRPIKIDFFLVKPNGVIFM